MAVKHLTYLALTDAQRATSASQARGRIKALLANPWITPAQTEILRAEMAKVGQWEHGALPVQAPKRGT